MTLPPVLRGATDAFNDRHAPLIFKALILVTCLQILVSFSTFGTSFFRLKNVGWMVAIADLFDCRLCSKVVHPCSYHRHQTACQKAGERLLCLILVASFEAIYWLFSYFGTQPDISIGNEVLERVLFFFFFDA